MTLLPSSGEMSSFDAETIAAGTPSLVLMERAGEAVFRELKNEYLIHNPRSRVVVLCGPGNNGGDGFVIARLLKESLIACDVITVASDRYSKDYIANRDKYAGPVSVFSGDGEDIIQILKRATVIVDALLGTGQESAPRGLVKDLVQATQLVLHMEKIPVVAVDIPTGVNGSTGEVFVNHIPAQTTISFQYLKRGLLQYPAADVVGRLIVVDIGIRTQRDTEFSLFDPGFFPLSKRHPYAHKGSFGTVLVVGGSKNMPGAPLLTCNAAYKAGAGLVIKAQVTKDLPLPEAILCQVADLKTAVQRSSAVVVGPGLGTGAQQGRLVKKVIDLCRKDEVPLVIDADGLNSIAGKKIPKLENCILTPHPGEAARLLGVKKEEVQRDSYTAVRELAKKFKSTVILKGHKTLTFSVDKGVVNVSGNPYMATAGSGDILAGVVVAFIAQGLSLFEAASWGVFIHGRAGDLAHEESGGPIIASEIAQFVPRAMGSTV